MRRVFVSCIAGTVLIVSCAKSPEQRNNAPDSAVVNSTPTAGLPGATASDASDRSAASQLTQTEGAPLFAFGFTDSSGGRVLIALSPAVPGEMLAFAGDTKPRLVTLLGAQQRSASDNGRQVAANFDNSEGLVFKVIPPPLEADQTVLLVNKSFLERQTPLAVTGLVQPTVLDTATLASIGRIRDLKARRGWRIASLPPGRSVALVEFHPKGDTVLLSLVLVDRNAFVFEDYPGNAGDETSVWRVDDGGEVSPDAFQILAAFDSSGVISMARMWAGPEGGSAALLRQDGTRFVEIGGDYRYWVPE